MLENTYTTVSIYLVTIIYLQDAGRVFYLFGICAELRARTSRLHESLSVLPVTSVKVVGLPQQHRKENVALEVSSEWYCLCDLLKPGFVQLLCSNHSAQ